MIYRAAHYRILAFIAFGALAAGCAPLTGSSSAGTGTGTCPSSLVALNSDAFPSDQQEIDGSTGVAQSFVIYPNQTVSSISLKLEAISGTTPQASPSGMLNVSVVQDAGMGSLPTSSGPNCSSSSGGLACANSLDTGFLSLSSVALYQPKYYNISLSTSVTVTGSTALAYWVVATTTNSSLAANYVVWDGTSSAGSSQLETVYTGGTVFTSWTALGTQNMTFQVCN